MIPEVGDTIRNSRRRSVQYTLMQLRLEPVVILAWNIRMPVDDDPVMRCRMCRGMQRILRGCSAKPSSLAISATQA